MYGTSGNFLLVKLLLLVSIHFAWHQVTILEEEREGGGGGGGAWAPMAPPLDPPLWTPTCNPMPCTPPHAIPCHVVLAVRWGNPHVHIVILLGIKATQTEQAPGVCVCVCVGGGEEKGGVWV